METTTTAPALRYRTNIHCGSCVQRLARVLEGIPGIHHWNADQTSPDRWVTIHGDINDRQARAAIEQAGLKVLDDTTPSASPADCPLPEHTAHEAPPAGFWSDRPRWRRASLNTLSCLLGCTIGDLGMIIYLQAFHPGTSMAVQMVLAVIAGLITSVALETVLMRYRERFAWGAALRMAVSMSFMSMVAMEVAMNTTDFMITGGKLLLSDPRYWLAFIPAAVAGFLVPLPYNYYQLKKHNKACH